MSGDLLRYNEATDRPLGLTDVSVNLDATSAGPDGVPRH
jgi:hypothetical protein